MHRFLTHDAIKEGCFNRTYCSAVAGFAAWPVELTNSADLLNLMIGRLVSDWTALNPKARRPITAREVDAWHKLRYQHDANNFTMIIYCAVCLAIGFNFLISQNTLDHTRKHVSGAVAHFWRFGKSSRPSSLWRSSLPRRNPSNDRALDPSYVAHLSMLIFFLRTLLQVHVPAHGLRAHCYA